MQTSAHNYADLAYDLISADKYDTISQLIARDWYITIESNRKL